MSRTKLLTVDLFAGAGGLTEGFRAAGFTCIFANDHERPALATFAQNHPDAETTADDIESLDAGAVRRSLGLEVGRLNVLLGGPPCQGFSTYGRRDSDDHRNQMYRHFLRFVGEFRPRYFVMENVTGLLSMDGGAVVADLMALVRRLGYGASVITLDAFEFGIPQYRKRVFVLGGRDGTCPPPPHAYTPSSGSRARRAIDDLGR